MPTRQSLLAALDAIQTNTHSKHALLANLQSRAIKVPLLVLYTSGSNTDPHFILACCHHPVSMCTVLPIFIQPNGLSAPAQPPPPPPPPFLLAPDYSLYTTASFFLSDSWIPSALSGLTFASLFEFQFPPFLSRCWQTGKFQLSFFQYHLKRALITCWRTRWRFSGVQKKQTSHHIFFPCPDNNSKAWNVFFSSPRYWSFILIMEGQTTILASECDALYFYFCP